MKYKNLSLILLNGLITVVVSLSFFRPGYAQTPTPTLLPVQLPTGGTDNLTSPTSTPLPTPVTGSTNATGVDPTLSPFLPAASLSDSQVISLTLTELGYEDVAIDGPVGQASFNLNLPSSWEVLPGSSLTLHYLSDLGLDDPAKSLELLVILNDVAIFRTVLANFDEQRPNIPLPEVWPERTQGDRLEILLRSRGECAPGSFSTLKILADTFLTLNYRTKTPQFDLAYYPSPIYERTFSTQSAYLVLPNQPSQLTIAGALSLRARLGNLTNNRLILTTTTASTFNPANLSDEHLIIVGTPENNSLLSYLNNSFHLPVPFQQRRLQLTGLGPEFIVPGAQLTYTLYLTNTEAISASNLKLNVQLPYPREQVSCQPGCQRVNNSLHWNIETLAPAAATAITLSFAYPLTATLEPVDLSFELAQNQKIINAGHWPSPLELPQPTPSSRFFFVLDGRAVPETDGVIQLLHSPWRFDQAILLVTGLTDEAVYKAERALGISPDLFGMTGQAALVQTILNDEMAPLELPQSFTLADLGYQDRVITNITRQDILYRFDLPSNWTLTPEAGVRFSFSHSPLLDPTRSSITLFFNSTPIASVALDNSNVFTGELNVLLPPEKAKPGQSNSLVARVELSLLNPCADTNSDRAWINLKAASALNLPHTLSESAGQFDLASLPIPFSGNSNLSDVMFVLPEQPSLAEYEVAMQIISYLGAASKGKNFQPLALFGYPTDVDLAGFHLIVIGRPSRSGLLQEVNESLPQPFMPGTDLIRPQVDKVVFRLPDKLDLGYLQLMSSNWSQAHALLAFTGTSDLGLTWTAQILTDPDKNDLLAGNLALIRPDLEVYTVDTRKMTTGGEIAALVTAVPQTVIVGTATPTPLPPTSTPAPQLASRLAQPPSAAFPELPEWFAYVIGGGIGLILVILAAAYWQFRRRTGLGV